MDKEEALAIISVGSFWLGLLLVLVSMFVKTVWIASALVVLGSIVGLLNIDVDEVVRFLLANISIIVGSAALKQLLSLFTLPQAVIGVFTALFDGLILFFAPAALIVAIKTLIDLSRD
jgi:hypothetical protein